MSKTLAGPGLAGLVVAALTGIIAAGPAAADPPCGERVETSRGKRLVVFALTSDLRLLRFRECGPDKATEVGALGVIAPDTTIVGMDFRVQDGLLYGVGDGGGIYTIDTATGGTTLVSALTVALDGTSFGVDFNPAADRLRIVSNTGQNLRHNVNPAGVTLVDTPLNNSGVPALGVTGAAYTNNDLDPATGTTLFDIDTTLDQVSIQSPPNNGSLVGTGLLTVDPDTPVGFDIYSRTRAADGKVLDNEGFASLVVGGQPGFYRVNLLTGRAVLIGPFTEEVIAIAIPIAQ